MKKKILLKTLIPLASVGVTLGTALPLISCGDNDMPNITMHGASSLVATLNGDNEATDDFGIGWTCNVPCEGSSYTVNTVLGTPFPDYLLPVDVLSDYEYELYMWCGDVYSIGSGSYQFILDYPGYKTGIFDFTISITTI